MYAIVFDLKMEWLRKAYPTPSCKNAYGDIRKVLVGEFGFAWQRGSTYFGGPDVTPVTCVLAVQALAARYEWFSESVRDIRMLRIEENNDLMPAISKKGA